MRSFKYEIKAKPVVDDNGRTELDKDGNPILKESVFEGHIELTIPKHIERVKLLKELNLKIDEQGNVGKGTDPITIMEKLSVAANEHVKKVDVKIKETGESITDLDTLGFYAEGSEIINDLGNMVLNGFKLGN